MAGRKFPIWECLFVHREKGLFLSVYVDDIKLAGKKQNLDPMWKLLNKEVDLGEPTSFLDHVYLGCTQRQCEISKDIVDNYRTMFESRISAGGVEKLPFPQNLRISSWSYDMAGHAKKCVERYCELANKTTQQLHKGRSPTMRHVSRTHRVALDWLFDRINLDPKIQIKYIDTKNQLADILTKGNFTRDEWNHLLTLFNISHFSSTVCTAAIAKRAQQESGEERVTAKSRPMMNLTARMPSVVSSSASANPGRTSYGYQDPGKSVASDDRMGKPEKPSPPGYSKEDYGQS